uniref:Phosphomannomutase n=1 Tax=Lygus hesperus TaxID=30085 RepID=A0A0A9W574_LYGHE
MAKKVILLFDVDGTLTPARKTATADMFETLKRARACGYTLGIVGGSDFAKQREQLGEKVLEDFDYLFSENGLLSFHKGQEFHRMSLLKYLGNDRVMAFVKKCLH